MNTSQWSRSARRTVMMGVGALLVGCGGGGGGGGSDFPFVAGVWDGTAFQVTASTCPATFPSFISQEETFPHTINQLEGEIVLEEVDGTTTPGRLTSDISFRMADTVRTRAIDERFAAQITGRFIYNLRSDEAATVVAAIDLLVVDAVTGGSGSCSISYSSEARKRG